MPTTSIRRAAAVALATAVVAGLLLPAGLAAADELPAEETTTTVLDEQTPVETPGAVTEDASAEPAPSEETSEPPVEPGPAAEEPVIASAEEEDEPAVEAEEEFVPTPTATSTNDPDPNRLDPGETLEVRYSVTSARIVTAWATGDDLEVSLVSPVGGRSTVTDYGSYHHSIAWWLGMPDGVWTLTIRNIGDDAMTPDFDLTYTTVDSTLGLFSSVGAPGLALATNPVIRGVASSDYVVHSQVTGPHGETHSQILEPWYAGSTGYQTTYEGLANGEYLARVWIVHEGVTYEQSMTVRVHEAETDPPVVEYSSAPAAPNADGWFARNVDVVLRGTDAGSGFWQLWYALDGAPETEGYSGNTIAVTGDGEHTLRYRGRDSQQNYSEWIERTIRIDSTKPTVSLYGPVEGARYDIGEEVFAEYQCGDATSGIVDCDGDLHDLSRIDTSEPGDFTFTVVATDLAGNTTREVRHYAVGPEDTTDPEVEAQVDAEPENGWYAGPVTVSLAASDDGTGVARLHWEYPTPSGTVVGGVDAETAEFTISRTGSYQVLYWAEDAAGNRSEARTLELSIDVDLPEIEIVEPQGESPTMLPNGHYAQNERVQVDFTCDDAGSGIDDCVGSTAAGEYLSTTTPGTHEFRVVATDLAGNRSERVVEYTVDAAPATGADTSGTPANTPRLAQTGTELLIPGVVFVAVLLAAGAMLLASRRLGGR